MLEITATNFRCKYSDILSHYNDLVIIYHILTLDSMVIIKEHNQRYLESMNYIIGENGLNIQSFAESIGVTRTLLSHIRSGKQNASIDLICNTINVYPELNADYILTGRGSMFIDSDVNDFDANEEIIRLHRELEDAYREIGKLNMELKAVKEHNYKEKRG